MSTETGQPEQKGWFARLRDGLSKSSRRLVDGITGLFVKPRPDAATLEQLEDLLIPADLRVETAANPTATLARHTFDTDVTAAEHRSEHPPQGNACVSTWRSRWSPLHQQ